MASDETLLGRTLGGRFRVTSFIGEGAMAGVYRGEQAEEPREVALKIMHPHLTGDPTFVSRFRREAKAASQIHHPNTVQILDCGVDEDVLYIAMELLGGKDLFDTLVLERRFAERRGAKILIEVCAALVVAHEKGIVHRDLKPENIMLLPDDAGGDRVKVLDFGIAKILERDASPSSEDSPSSPASSVLTKVGMVVGTPAYMSPEQCRGEPVDARSDVYSCGILLYQLVSGRLPFAGDNAMDVAIKQVRSPPPPLKGIVPGINAGLDLLIQTALNKWPAERQQSAAELKAQLEKLVPQLAQKPLDIGSARATAKTAPPAPPPELRQRSQQQTLGADAVTTLRSSPISIPKPIYSSRAATLASEAVTPPQPKAAPAGRATTKVTRPALAAKPPARPDPGAWTVILIAVVVGVVLGVLAYFLTR